MAMTASTSFTRASEGGRRAQIAMRRSPRSHMPVVPLRKPFCAVSCHHCIAKGPREEQLMNPKAVTRACMAVAVLSRGAAPATAGEDAEAAREAYFQGDYARAAEIAAPLAAAGDVVAMNLMAVLYQKGLAVEPDLGRALALYEAACEGGFARACHNLGVLREYGEEGLAPDFAAAAAAYEKGIALGYAPSMTSRGAMHYRGKGGDADAAAAAALYRQAVELGDLDAMNNLGLLHVHGEGVARDYAEAWALFQRAAQAGHLSALTNLGAMHDNGNNTPRDRLAAYALYRLAAERGEAQAAVNAARFLIEEEGALADPVEGWVWCLRVLDAAGAADGASIEEECTELAAEVPPQARAEAEARFTGEAARQ
ncbi:MAG: sel1 repeat family protein [Alphaproteobacteria bacterium]|nr:MAG: sel1 repeat family protein [Alphaproteobacteria bacterium]